MRTILLLKNLLKPYGTFLWMGFNFLKAAESLLVDSLLFTSLLLVHSFATVVVMC